MGARVAREVHQGEPGERSESGAGQRGGRIEWRRSRNVGGGAGEAEPGQGRKGAKRPNLEAVPFREQGWAEERRRRYESTGGSLARESEPGMGMGITREAGPNGGGRLSQQVVRRRFRAGQNTWQPEVIRRRTSSRAVERASSISKYVPFLGAVTVTFQPFSAKNVCLVVLGVGFCLPWR